LVVNTKVSDVGLKDILKIFSGVLRQGGVTKEKFAEGIAKLGLTDFPVDMFF